MKQLNVFRRVGFFCFASFNKSIDEPGNSDKLNQSTQSTLPSWNEWSLNRFQRFNCMSVMTRFSISLKRAVEYSRMLRLREGHCIF